MTARVIVGAGSVSNIVVPLTAVVDNGSGAAVWVIQDGRATPRAVVIERFREDGAVLASGLQPGELVILSGQRRLTAGQAVQVQQAPPPERQH